MVSRQKYLLKKTDVEIRMNLKKSLDPGPAGTLPLKKSRFTEMLIEANAPELRGFDRWIFCEGMLFNSPNKWWGDRGRRDFPHEGIDLCLYRDGSGRIRRIDDNIRFPAVAAGTVQAMFKDYLGTAVLVEHQIQATGSQRLISFYAHTNPDPNIGVGMMVKEGDIIGALADTSHSKAGIRPHLHFSIGMPTKSFSYDGLVWNTIRRPEMMILLDPLPVIDRPYQKLAAGDPACRQS